LEKFRIRTFGRIKSRNFSDSKINKLNNILPKYQIKINNDKVENLPFSYNKIFFEVGFGYGEHTAHQAILNKDCLVIGCETYINGVISLVSKIEENNLQNIRIFNGDARDLLEKLPDNFIDKIFILFPDPWPKKRQNKKRIISSEFLDILKLKLKNNGTFFFASDILDYIEWTMDFAKDKFIQNFNNIDECLKEPNWWIKTRYQEKAISEGRKSYFLEYLNKK